MSSQCVWIGVGVAIDESNVLYENLVAMRDFLSLNYNNTLKDEFHLNLYDVAVPEENLDMTVEIVSKIAGGQKKMKIGIRSVDYFPFGPIVIRLEKDKELLSLHADIVAAINPLRGTCVEPGYLEEKRKYTEQQKEMLARYGNPFVFGEFNPHITVGFIKQPDRLENAKEAVKPFLTQTEFMVDNLNLVREVVGGYRELHRIQLV